MGGWLGGMQSGSIYYEKMHASLYKRFLGEAQGGPTKYFQISQLSQASQKRTRPGAGKVQRLLVPDNVAGNVVVECPTDRRSQEKLWVLDGSDLQAALRYWLAVECDMDEAAVEVPTHVWKVNSMDIQIGAQSVTRLRCSEDYYGGPWYDAAMINAIADDGETEITGIALVMCLFLMDMPDNPAGGGEPRKLLLIRWLRHHNPYPLLPQVNRNSAMRGALKFLREETDVRAFKISPDPPQIVAPEMVASLVYVEKGYHTVRADDPDFYWLYPFHQF